MFRHSTLAVALVFVTFATLQARDPVGTWRWDNEDLQKQGVVQNVLVLTRDRGILTGVCSGTAGEIPVSAVSFEGDKLTWSIDVEMRGRPVTTVFSGKLVGEELLGQVIVGTLGEYSWRAGREQEWRFHVKIPDGDEAYVISPMFHFSKLKGGVVGHVNNDGDVFPIKNIVFRDGGAFSFDVDVPVISLKSKFRGQIQGDTAKGIVEYDYGGDTGETDFTAERVP